MNLNDLPQLPLEKIFDKLPEKDLLTACLVSKKFHQAFIPAYLRYFQDIFEQMQKILLTDEKSMAWNKLILQPTLRRYVAKRMLAEAKLNLGKPIAQIEAKLCSIYLQRKFINTTGNFSIIPILPNIECRIAEEAQKLSAAIKVRVIFEKMRQVSQQLRGNWLPALENSILNHFKNDLVEVNAYFSGMSRYEFKRLTNTGEDIDDYFSLKSSSGITFIMQLDESYGDIAASLRLAAKNIA